VSPLWLLLPWRVFRNDTNFNLYWKKTTDAAANLNVSEPALPRRRKALCWFDEGSTPTYHKTVEDHYRVIYFKALDLIVTCIENRFDQPGYKSYGIVQTLLLKAAASKPHAEELQFVLSFYGSDFDSMLLPTHLEIFFQTIKRSEKMTISEFFRTCSPSQCKLMSQVSKMVKLLLVMPATNAQSERSFSALRRVKTYLRATMSQQRLNHLMLCIFTRVELMLLISWMLPMSSFVDMNIECFWYQVWVKWFNVMFFIIIVLFTYLSLHVWFNTKVTITWISCSVITIMSSA